ncbi:MAG: SUMF1/EgtB/PvdO family nonheme iron enzyme [Chitinivibrionales bacterium]|nr:SUMF1/EgtB/PvdO family nonheme iron enzyme [Chitinivibrionales bacterium]
MKKSSLIVFTACAVALLVSCSKDKITKPSDLLQYNLRAYGADTSGLATITLSDTLADSLQTEPAAFAGQPITFVAFLEGDTANLLDDTAKATSSWNFGDGTGTYKGSRTEHTFNDSGPYKAVFNITDKSGFSLYDTVFVTVHGVYLAGAKGIARFAGKGAADSIEVVFTNKAVAGVQISPLFTRGDGLYEMASGLPPGTYSIAFTDQKYKVFKPLILDSVVIAAGRINVLPLVTLPDSDLPVISQMAPTGVVASRFPTLSASFADAGSGISPHTFFLKLNNDTIPDSLLTLDATKFSYTSAKRLADGDYTATATVLDSAGNPATQIWSFKVNAISITAQDTSVRIKDTGWIVSHVSNVYSGIAVYKWDFEGTGVWDDTLATKDTLVSRPHKYIKAGVYKAVVYCRDDAGTALYDTVKVTVLQDVPKVKFISADTVVEHGGTVRCSVYVQQQFGSMVVEMDSANSGTFKNIGSLGLSGGASASFATGDACAWDSVKVRITDDDSNVVVKGFRVRIRPRALTITSIDSTTNTITVQYSKTAETDFSSYKIYRSTDSTVDTTKELWATVSDSGIINYTNTTPDSSWQPRYYRVFQKDSENVWSVGSNVVYGNIVNRPPPAPVITYPASNGDSIWSDAILSWSKCPDPNGQSVKYRVLINRNNLGDTELATAIADTFVQLSHVDSLGISFKVIAYDSVGDSGAYSPARTAVVKNISIRGMRLVHAGTFSMGQAGVAVPVHDVTISKDFWMDTTVVTQQRYKAVMGTNPSHFTGDSTLPVETVQWYDAARYCNALSKMMGLDTCYQAGTYSWNATWACDFSKNGYHLPTEAEWEYACRAGSTTLYYWGDDTAGVDGYAWWNGNSGNTTHSVATKLPNAWGLYDMAGNVWEWCNDFDGAYTSGPQIDPTGPTTGAMCVIRACAYTFANGSYVANVTDMQSAKRNASYQSGSSSTTGFRVVRLR